MTKPDWEGFARAIMEYWPHGDVDGFDLQELAEKHGMIVEVPGGFNPDEHDDDGWGAEPGDKWYKTTFIPR